MKAPRTVQDLDDGVVDAVVLMPRRVSCFDRSSCVKSRFVGGGSPPSTRFVESRSVPCFRIWAVFDLLCYGQLFTKQLDLAASFCRYGLGLLFCRFGLL